MVKPSENEFRTPNKSMLMFTYKDLPGNDKEIICRQGKKEDHTTVTQVLSEIYGQPVHITLV